MKFIHPVFLLKAEQNDDTKIAMDHALDHHNRLQGADRNVGQMLYTGMNALEQMKNQRMSLKVYLYINLFYCGYLEKL